VSTSAFKSRDASDGKISGVDGEFAPPGRFGNPASLEEEVRQMREEFAAMRALILDREMKGRTLIEGYRDVIADFADLFESQRNENIKRDESLRFFLNSIEGRLKTDIQNELSGGRNVRNKKRWWWPLRRSQ
jgi:hypothetical protein